MKFNYLLTVLLVFNIFDIVMQVGGDKTEEKSERIDGGAREVSDLENETSTNRSPAGNPKNTPLAASENELLSSNEDEQFEVERMYGGGEIKDCMVCGIRLPSAELLQIHLNKHFPEDDEQSAPSVGVIYNSPCNIHRVVHNYTCSCGAVLPSYESYASHTLHTHGFDVGTDGEPPMMSDPAMYRPAPVNNPSTAPTSTMITRPRGPLRCPKCRYETKVPENMAGHLRTRHASGRTEALNCPVCFGRYMNTSTLADHLELQHDLNAPPPPAAVADPMRETCPVCHYIPNIDEPLQAHFIKEHPNIIGKQKPPTQSIRPQQPPSNEHGCPFCGKGFPSAEAALRHVTVFHKEGPEKAQPRNTQVQQQQASANINQDRQNQNSVNRQNSRASVGSNLSRETNYHTPMGSISRQTTVDSISRESSHNSPGSPISREVTMGHISRLSSKARNVLGNLSIHSRKSSTSASSSRSSQNSSHDFSGNATDNSKGTSSAATDSGSRGTTLPDPNVIGNFLGQSKNELDVAVRWLKMKRKDANQYIDELNQAEGLGIDSGHTFIGGVAVGIKEASSKTQWPKVTFANVVENMDFYGTSYGDRGWGCGYRNLQMIWSSLLENPLYSGRVKNKMEEFRIADTSCVPSIDMLQSMIQKAWEQGFDPQGRQNFQGRLRSTRKCIGPAEIVTILSSIGIKCEWIHTTSPSALVKWISNYFNIKGLKPRTPMFLQVPGHSRLVIGMELINNKATDELIVDPDNRRSDMNDITQYKKNGMAARRAVSKLRFNVFKFKQDRYQMVRVIGIMESRTEYQESKNMKPKLYTLKD